VRSPITGKLTALDVQAGQSITAGAQIATLAPEGDQVWEALRALYIVGKPEDLSIVQSYERELPEIPDRVRQQAAETEKAIKSRS
jgi:pyruvate/2-oxoglutarate dehydrogenase complex dihydrolipoamide acyltransferase (E2) component